MKPVYTAFFCLLFFPVAASGADEFGGVKRVDLRVASGAISIEGVDGDAATVEVKKKRYDERCRLVVEQKGDLLFIELASKSLFSARCEADFTLKLPRAAALKIQNGSGDVRAAGLRAPAKIRTGSGNMRLAFAEVPGEGGLEIQSGSGSAEVLFPQKSRIRTSFSAGSGRMKNLLGESADARFTVTMKTGSGSLTVGKL